jgi:muramoyltetrapeptide carboxypeptidase LdcA involved in peptidoglycan recycling
VVKPSEILKQADQLAEEAKSWLSKLGYKVEPEKLSRDEVQKMIMEAQKQALANLPTDDLKKRLQEAGYKIVGGPLTYEQVEKLVEEAKRKAQEEAIDDKRIDAVAGIIRESVTKIIEMFRPAVEVWLQSAPQPSGGSETRVKLKEASK